MERQLLALRAISKALQTDQSRSVGAEHQGGRLVPPEWHPHSGQEDQEVRLSVLALLDRALNCPTPAVREEAEKVLLDHARNSVAFGLADEVESLEQQLAQAILREAEGVFRPA